MTDPVMHDAPSSDTSHSISPDAPVKKSSDRTLFFSVVVALVLVLVPIFKLEELSFLVWPFVLLVDVLAIVLAVNVAIVWYLFKNRARLIRHHHHHH